jgi:prevent-host-death family protein
MEILTVTQARANLYRLVDQASAGHNPVFIQGKHSKAILISEDDWRSISETLHLESIPGMKESIRKGMKEPLSRSKPLKDVDW